MPKMIQKCSQDDCIHMKLAKLWPFFYNIIHFFSLNTINRLNKQD